MEIVPFSWSPNTVNDSGTVAGTFRAEVPSGKGKKTRTVDVAARFDMQGDLQPLTDRSSTGIDINQSGDVVMPTFQNASFDSPYLYHSDANGNVGYGLLNLDDLVVGTEDDIAFWFEAHGMQIRSMNDRDSADFAQIVVNAYTQTTTGKGKRSVTTREYRQFLLTPVPLP